MSYGLKILFHQLVLVVHACNPSTQEVEAGGSRVSGQPGLHIDFEANLGYIARFFLKTGKKPIIFYHMIQQSHYLEYIFKGNGISIFKIHLQLPGSLQHYS
jgi:hypothetical protein